MIYTRVWTTEWLWSRTQKDSQFLFSSCPRRTQWLSHYRSWPTIWILPNIYLIIGAGFSLLEGAVISRNLTLEGSRFNVSGRPRPKCHKSIFKLCVSNQNQIMYASVWVLASYFFFLCYMLPVRILNITWYHRHACVVSMKFGRSYCIGFGINISIYSMVQFSLFEGVFLKKNKCFH